MIRESCKKTRDPITAENVVKELNEAFVDAKANLKIAISKILTLDDMREEIYKLGFSDFEELEYHKAGSDLGVITGKIYEALTGLNSLHMQASSIGKKNGKELELRRLLKSGASR